MALFDACKAFEDNKAWFAADDHDSTQESSDLTGSGAEAATLDEQMPVREIRPLDPAKANLRYLPPKGDDAPQFTLVLDFDETLIHYRDNSPETQQTEEDESMEVESGTKKLGEPSEMRMLTEDDEEGAFFIRPGLSSFLETLSKHYELVLFTAATREYADYFLR